MEKIASIDYGNFYHIYNRGINSTPLFKEEDNYLRFLKLYDKYINTIAETFAWCLMGNHFHFLVRIKSEEEIGHYIPLNADRSIDAVRFNQKVKLKTDKDLPGLAKDLSASTGSDSVRGKNNPSNANRSNRSFDAVGFSGKNILIAPNPSRHFSHLFNAYTKYFNNRYSRHGALFERPFRRIKLESETHLKNLIVYIHNNPVHHGYCQHPIEYPWSSYLTCISEKTTRLKREDVLEMFDNRENFEYCHRGNDIPEEALILESMDSG